MMQAKLEPLKYANIIFQKFIFKGRTIGLVLCNLEKMLDKRLASNFRVVLLHVCCTKMECI